MKSIFQMMAAACMIVGFTADRASADMIFSLSDVRFAYQGTSTPAGTLTGTFTTNDAMDMVKTVDFTASANSPFSSFNYSSPGQTLEFSLPWSGNGWLRLTSIEGNQLQLALSSPLTATGATLYVQGSSSEHQSAAGNRIVSAGSIVAGTAAVPEPGALALIAIGIPAVLGVATRRRKAAVA